MRPSEERVTFVFISTLPDTNFFNYKSEVVKEQMAKTPNDNGCSAMAVSASHPKSKGTITLRSTDAFDYPIIDPQYLTDQRDIKDFIAALRIWKRFIETPTMQSLGAKVEHAKTSFCSQHEFRSDAFWECVVRHLAVTEYHHCGTCKMGRKGDPTAVVDPQLRVIGIKGLRVVDASVLPNVTTGSENFPMSFLLGSHTSCNNKLEIDQDLPNECDLTNQNLAIEEIVIASSSGK